MERNSLAPAILPGRCAGARPSRTPAIHVSEFASVVPFAQLPLRFVPCPCLPERPFFEPVDLRLFERPPPPLPCFPDPDSPPRWP